MSDKYLEPYRESAERHGTDFGVTLWADEGTQRLRFKVFAQMCPFAGKRILDAGCSRGDLAAYLIEHDIAYEHFVGVDGLDQVIEYANGRGLANSEFHAGDFLRNPGLLSVGEPDVICISGALNTMTDSHVQQVLESSWSAAREVLMFNFLSNRAGSGAWLQLGPARRLDTFKLMDWALSKTWCVSFRQDYFKHGHDATILMRKT